MPRLTKHMISKVGEPIGFILYQRDDDGGTKYKIQRTLAGGVRVKEWYTPEQMEEGVLNLLLPRFVQRAYERMKRPGLQRSNLKTRRIALPRAG